MEILLLCIKIFFARIVDVSLGTFRTVLTVKGKNTYAAIVAFFEVFIWFLIAREVLNTELKTLFIPIAYASGYATGTYIGGIISQIFISGIIGIEVITNKDNAKIIETLRENGYGVSIMPLKNSYNETEKDMLLIQVNKKKQNDVVKLIKKHDSKAFIVINETKTVQNGFLK